MLNRRLIDHTLRAARRLTESDTDALIAWSVLAHQNIVHLMPHGSLPSAVLDDRGMPHDSEQRMVPLRLRTLAEITRIPRETVRRYVARYAAVNGGLAELAMVLLSVIVESVVNLLGG